MSAEGSLSFDFPGFKVGSAVDPAGPTGCTVFRFDRPLLGAIDVRGGFPALRDTQNLELDSGDGLANALVLAGGSTHGLRCASGVMDEILRARGGSVRFSDIPCVPAAVVYDYFHRKNAVIPTEELASRAYRDAEQNRVDLGQAGAGANVYAGKVYGREGAGRSGQGAAFLEKKGTKVFALTILNAYGNILDRQGRLLCGQLGAPGDEGPQTGNTTLTVVIVNTSLDRVALRRLAIMAHTSMARVIEPFHTPLDGDTLFFLSTGNPDSAASGEPSPNLLEVGALASRAAQDAVLSVYRH